MRPRSLYFRLMGAFALVIVVGIASVYFIANQTTTQEFQTFMFRGQMVRAQDLVTPLADYYAAHGNWNGVDALLTSAGNGPGPGGMMGTGMMGTGMNGASLRLADPRGVIVAATDHRSVGQTLDASTLAQGTPIREREQTVGTLLIDAGMMSGVTDAAAQDFLSQVNRSLLLAGLAAGVIALALGFLLFRQIMAPLDTLAAASRRIATGDLDARAAVRGDDEIAQVANSFNAMAEQLARSETARRHLLADVAHELRNPIGVLQSHLEAILDGVFPATPEQIASLHDETLFLTRLVDDLRELALAEAGQLRLARQATDLGALVARTVEAFQAQAAEQQLTLTTTATTELPPLDIDPQRIGQVLSNLLSNALRYTPAGGRVEVRLGTEGKDARVEVRDTGIGIAPEALPHVFERFWRADQSRARVQGGSGLGLAIAKQWVEAHGGQIGVTSRDDGTATQEDENPPSLGGTIFWFTLPYPNPI